MSKFRHVTQTSAALENQFLKVLLNRLNDLNDEPPAMGNGVQFEGAGGRGITFHPNSGVGRWSGDHAGTVVDDATGDMYNVHVKVVTVLSPA